MGAGASGAGPRGLARRRRRRRRRGQRRDPGLYARALAKRRADKAKSRGELLQQAIEKSGVISSKFNSSIDAQRMISEKNGGNGMEKVTLTTSPYHLEDVTISP